MRRWKPLFVPASATTITSSASVRRWFLADVLTFRFMLCEFLRLVGRHYRQLPTFVAKKKASVIIQNTENRSFGYEIAAARPNIAENPYLPRLYKHLY